MVLLLQFLVLWWRCHKLLTVCLCLFQTESPIFIKFGKHVQQLNEIYSSGNGLLGMSSNMIKNDRYGTMFSLEIYSIDLGSNWATGALQGAFFWVSFTVH
jgi:hypothetical protein